MYAHPTGPPGSQEETSLDEAGLNFTSKAIAMLESRGELGTTKDNKIREGREGGKEMLEKK